MCHSDPQGERGSLKKSFGYRKHSIFRGILGCETTFAPDLRCVDRPLARRFAMMRLIFPLTAAVLLAVSASCGSPPRLARLISATRRPSGRPPSACPTTRRVCLSIRTARCFTITGKENASLARGLPCRLPSMLYGRNKNLTRPACRSCGPTGRLTACRLSRRLALTDPPPAGTPRGDLILVRVTNTAATARTLSPKLVVDSAESFRIADRWIVFSGGESMESSLKIAGPAAGKLVPLEALAIPAGKSAALFLLYGGGGRDRWPARRRSRRRRPRGRGRW